MIYAALRMLIIILKLLFYSNTGRSDLIEECSFPWKPFHITATSEGILDTSKCKDKCQGNAFHGKEGRLVCFNEKDVAQRKRNYKDRKTKNVTCECGYYGKIGKRQWMSCDDGNTFVTSKDVCDVICMQKTVYLRVQHDLKTLLYWEEEMRNEYYDIHAEVGDVQHVESKWNSRYRICTCGIKDNVLKQLTVKDTTKQDTFDECDDPWQVKIFHRIHTLDTCNSYCHDYCKRGWAFYYDGKPFCYHIHLPAKRRNIQHGGIEGECECGYSKRKSRNEAKRPEVTEFFHCKPSVFKNNLKYRECTKFCAEFSTFLYIIKNKAFYDVRCLSKHDFGLLKPQKLVSKCDDKVYDKGKKVLGELRRNDSKKFTICRCGMGGNNYTANAALSSNREEISLPDTWTVKKKRSSRCYQRKKV